jgi:hypothetical protein
MTNDLGMAGMSAAIYLESFEFFDPAGRRAAAGLRPVLTNY